MEFSRAMIRIVTTTPTVSIENPTMLIVMPIQWAAVLSVGGQGRVKLPCLLSQGNAGKKFSVWLLETEAMLETAIAGPTTIHIIKPTRIASMLAISDFRALIFN